MKRILILVVLIMVLPVLVNNLYSQIQGTGHDLSSTGPLTDAGNETRICIFCHTPHSSSGVDQPLWNRTNSLSTFTVYTSDTFKATTSIADIAPGPNASMQCMSCHDGTVAVNSLINPSNEFGTPTMGSGAELDVTGKLSNSLALLGTDLTDDHPVNFLWSESITADPTAFKNQTAVTQLLFSGKIQCASCHDVHDNTLQPFLTVDPAQSQLCLTCHDK